MARRRPEFVTAPDLAAPNPAAAPADPVTGPGERWWARRRFRLFFASFLLLYFELTLIRWIPGQVRVIAYFTNFTLIAAFFGMGVGMMLADRRFTAARWAAPGILGIVLLAVLFRGLWVWGGQGGVVVFLEYEGPERTQVPLYAVLVVFYIAITMVFVPLGQVIGRCFGKEAPLLDYAANLIGSMFGIVVFSVVSFFAWPAWVWFVIGMPVLAVLCPGERRTAALTLVCTAVAAGIVYEVNRDTLWSPYQKIDITPMVLNARTGNPLPYQQAGPDVLRLPVETGFNVRVNDDFYQLPVDLSDASVARYPALRRLQRQYDLPYILKPNAERVLIVGGGTGNDAAAALRHGAQHVDMVDIDPEIVAIGHRRHPEKPYSDPRVQLHIDDARHFLHRAEPGYDVVVFALLDSHRLFSTLSSLRLDSYVFTVESFRAARRLLKPDGVQVTAFSVGTPWMMSRLYEMLRLADGSPPVLMNVHEQTALGLVFLSGPGKGAYKLPPAAVPPVTRNALPTDDWPFIYARERVIPHEYLIALGLVLLVSTVTLAVASGRARVPNMHFFTLGVGFLLLETKNITTVALVFGSTWYVNSIVFFSILTMALAAALLLHVWKRLPPIGFAYAGLFGAIALNAFVPVQHFTGASLPVRLLVVGGITALPLFFSGLVFAHTFKHAANPAHALASNVLGGVFGGVLEYSSLIMGMRFLFVLVAAFYLLSLLALLRPRAATPVPG